MGAFAAARVKSWFSPVAIAAGDGIVVLAFGQLVAGYAERWAARSVYTPRAS